MRKCLLLGRILHVNNVKHRINKGIITTKILNRVLRVYKIKIFGETKSQIEIKSKFTKKVVFNWSGIFRNLASHSKFKKTKIGEKWIGWDNFGLYWIKKITKLGALATEQRL